MTRLPRARGLLLVAGVAIAVAVALIGRAAIRLAALPWLADGPGEWILYPAPPQTQARTAVELDTAFSVPFTLAAAPTSAQLEVRCFRRCEVAVNGRRAFTAGPPAPWLRTHGTEVAGLLRAGENSLLAVVANATGPPALSLAVVADGHVAVETGPAWQVSVAGASWRPARRADAAVEIDPGLPDPNDATLAGALVGHRLALLGLALAAAGATAGAGLVVRRLPHRDLLLPAVLAAIVVLWLALYLHNAGQVPARLGFDADGHLDVIDFIQRHHRLPRADQGWEAHQPPLYYAISAALLAAAGLTVSDPGAVWVLRGLTFACGIAQVLLVFAAVRLLVPRRPFAQAMALLLAGFLPAHLYLAHYPSNENLFAPLATATLVLTLLLLRRRRPGWRAHAGVGVCLGVALLAKLTALLLVPAVLAALLWPRGERGGGRRTRVAGAAVTLAACLAVGGWPFAWRWVEFGSPLIGNWGYSLEWWQHPGYRTLDQYVRFGRALVAPWYAGFASVWDGLYSTLWGDGMAAGRIAVRDGAPWNQGLMTVGFALAAVPTAAIAFGSMLAVRRLVRRFEARWLLAVGAAVFLGGGWLLMTLRVLSFAQAKAFYVLPAVAPAAAALALAAAWIAHRPWLRAIFAASMVLWAANSFAAVWVVRNATTLVTLGRSHLGAGEPELAEKEFAAALARRPGDPAARMGLARSLEAQGRDREAERQAALALSLDPGNVDAVLAKAARLDDAGELAAAEAAVRAALARAPGEPRALAALASIAAGRGHPEQAVAALRDLLAIAPESAPTHRELARLYTLIGKPDAAAAHLRYAARIDEDTRDPRPADPLLVGRRRIERALEAEAAGRGEALAGEEAEQVEVVPGDLGAQGGDAEGAEVEAELAHHRAGDAAAALGGRHADGVDRGRRLDHPVLAVVESGDEEPHRPPFALGDQRHLQAGVLHRPPQHQLEVARPPPAAGRRVDADHGREVVGAHRAHHHPVGSLQLRVVAPLFDHRRLLDGFCRHADIPARRASTRWRYAPHSAAPRAPA